MSPDSTYGSHNINVISSCDDVIQDLNSSEELELKFKREICVLSVNLDHGFV